MKANPSHNPLRAGAVMLRRTLGRLALASCLCLPAVLPAADAGTDDGKNYTIFVGTDLAVHDALGRSPVVGAEKHTVIVRQKGTRKKVPLDGIKGLQFERGIKLSSLSAEVDDLKISFTSQATNRAWFEATSVQIALQTNAIETRDRAIGQVSRASTAPIPVGNDSQGIRQGARAAAAAQLAQAETDLVAGINDSASMDTVAGMHGERYQEEVRKLGADTVNLSFSIRSPRPVGPGFVAVVTEYQIGGERGAIQHGISVDEFDHLDEKPRRFRMQQNALPDEWALKSHRVVVYAEGQEIATNFSERRTRVTKDEAHQFIVLQYVTAGRGQTRGPSTVLMAPRPQLRAAARQADLPEAIFVKVDKTGAVLSLSTDRFGIAKVPPACEALLENIRFLPALENGTPVEGTTRLAMADLLR